MHCCQVKPKFFLYATEINYFQIYFSIFKHFKGNPIFDITMDFSVTCFLKQKGRWEEIIVLLHSVLSIDSFSFFLFATAFLE